VADRPALGYLRKSATSTSSRTSLASRNPPVSSGAFQVRSQSSRLTLVAAEKPDFRLPHGSVPTPRNSRSKVTGRVTPRIVRSPSIFQTPSSAGRIAVLRKVIVG